jgi:hypothetical protein
MGMGHAAAFSRFAFKALPVCGKEGLWFSAHLFKQDGIFEQACPFTRGVRGWRARTREERRRVEPPLLPVSRSACGRRVWACWSGGGCKASVSRHFALRGHSARGFGQRAMALLQEHVAGPPLVWT